MRNIISADRNQTFILPPCLEDWIAPAHPARFILEFVNQLDLKTMGLDTISRGEGGTAYAPEILLCIWLYGYYKKTFSLRKLELACHEELGFIWLTGNNRPDHNALWRFWDEHKEAIKNIFKETVKLAVKTDMVGFAVQALDGTKIQARCSGYGKYDENSLLLRLENIDSQIAQMEKTIKDSRNDPSLLLPKELEKKGALREKIKNALKEVQEGKEKYVHPQEPDARRLKINAVGNRFGHNAQAISDKKNNIIVHSEVVDTATDQHQLVPMIEGAESLRKEVLSELSSEVCEDMKPKIVELEKQGQPLTKADTGYAIISQLQEAKEKHYPVETPPPEGWGEMKSEYHSGNFTYDKEGDFVTCPRKQKLERKGGREQSNRELVYYRNATSCRQCPVRLECCGKSRYRTIGVCGCRKYLEELGRKWRDDKAYRKSYKERSAMIEPRFSQVKQQLGFRRWSFFSLTKVKVQWSFMCSVLNLLEMGKKWWSKISERGESSFFTGGFSPVGSPAMG
jgi:transposase